MKLAGPRLHHQYLSTIHNELGMPLLQKMELLILTGVCLAQLHYNLLPKCNALQLIHCAITAHLDLLQCCNKGVKVLKKISKQLLNGHYKLYTQTLKPFVFEPYFSVLLLKIVLNLNISGLHSRLLKACTDCNRESVCFIHLPQSLMKCIWDHNNPILSLSSGNL